MKKNGIDFDLQHVAQFAATTLMWFQFLHVITTKACESWFLPLLELSCKGHWKLISNFTDTVVYLLPTLSGMFSLPWFMNFLPRCAKVDFKLYWQCHSFITNTERDVIAPLVYEFPSRCSDAPKPAAAKVQSLHQHNPAPQICPRAYSDSFTHTLHTHV